MNVDIAIVGAGPVGLAFARSMQDSGHSIALIDRQPLDTLAQPAFDGREIALTHASRHILERLGAWQRIDPAQVSQLRDAKIFNGASTHALRIDAALAGVGELGYFVPNHLIRQALFESVRDRPEVALIGSVGVAGVETGEARNRLVLTDGRSVEARLVVAADSRHSETRRMMGIGADLHDFGRTMMVCRFAHEKPHDHVSWQWFDLGQTKALLPLNGERSNVALTLPPRQMQALLALDDAALSAEVTRRFGGRLGAMRKEGAAHAYPLVAVYARRFVAQRYALIGDAAVGMHPVTAHGFNFGLQGQKRLADQLLAASRRGRDLADPRHLSAYERQHRLATWPLYQATNHIARLYTDDRIPARLLRDGALRLAHAVYPFRRALAAHLTQA